jgi:hypothetical protein
MTERTKHTCPAGQVLTAKLVAVCPRCAEIIAEREARIRAVPKRRKPRKTGTTMKEPT